MGGVATWIIREQLVDLRAVLAAGLKACLVEAWQEAEAIRIIRDCAGPIPVVDLWVVAVSQLLPWRMPGSGPWLHQGCLGRRR